MDNAKFTDRLNWLFANVPKPGTNELWTNKDLVDAINARPTGEATLSYSYLSALRKGDRTNPGLRLTQAIAAEFGVKIDYFLGPEEEDKRGPIILAGTEDLQLGHAETELLGMLARMLARKSAIGPIPAIGNLTGPGSALSEHDAYQANDLVDALQKAAEIYETTFGAAAAAGALRNAARGILNDFAIAASKARPVTGRRVTSRRESPPAPR